MIAARRLAQQGRGWLLYCILADSFTTQHEKQKPSPMSHLLTAVALSVSSLHGESGTDDDPGVDLAYVERAHNLISHDDACVFGCLIALFLLFLVISQTNILLHSMIMDRVP
jgi:hypothetical protein